MAQWQYCSVQLTYNELGFNRARTCAWPGYTLTLVQRMIVGLSLKQIELINISASYDYTVANRTQLASCTQLNCVEHVCVDSDDQQHPYGRLTIIGRRLECLNNLGSFQFGQVNIWRHGHNSTES